MTELMQIYKCNVCGNLVEVLHPGAGELVCCSEPMELMIENTDEHAKVETHLPEFVDMDGQRKIRIGSVPHPMTEEHFIMFIEAISPDKKYTKRVFLKPNEEPELELKCNCAKIDARGMCNIHGLWSRKNYD